MEANTFGSILICIHIVYKTDERADKKSCKWWVKDQPLSDYSQQM